jgi:glycosyltransferase involved in cell wall biosynthesis
MLDFASFESTTALANVLAAHCDLHLVVPASTYDYVRDDLDPRIRVEPFALPRLRQPCRQAAMCRRLIGLVERIRPDVVHLQQGHAWFNYALPRLKRYPLVVTVHEVRYTGRPRNGERSFPQPVVKRAFHAADELIVYGRAMRPALVAEGVAGEHVHVSRRALPALAREIESERADEPRVLFFGRIWPYKGLEHLIAAEPYVAARAPDVRFVIAGAGEGFDRYRSYMRDPARFEVHNYFVSRDLRDRLFAQAAVVALPYVYASTSAVVPIAQLHRRAVVATRVGGLPEAVEHGRTGLIVPPADPGALGEAIADLLTDPDRCRAMGEAGRRDLESRSSPDIVAEETLGVYERAIGTHGGGG